MRRIDVYRWFLGASMLLCASAVVADDCPLERLTSVDMIVTKDGQVQIPVEINGIRVRMGIDAGSGLSAIWSGATAALNLQPKERIAHGRLAAGVTPLTQTVKIDGLVIGNSTAAKLPVTTVNSGSGRSPWSAATWRRAGFGHLRSVGHLNYCPKGDNGIAIAPSLNIRTLQY